MNDAAKAFAGRLLKAGGDVVEDAVQMAYGRPPLSRERELLEQFLTSQQERHQQADASVQSDEAYRRAVGDLRHMLLNSNEFVYID